MEKRNKKSPNTTLNGKLEQDFVQLSQELLENINSTLESGVTQNELAGGINIQVVVLSNLKNHVLPKIINHEFPTYYDMEVSIKDLRCMKSNIYLEFEDFIQKIKSFRTSKNIDSSKRSSEKSIYRKWKEGLAAQIASSTENLVKKKYDGLYYFYNFSSLDNGKISKLPMLIKKSEFDSSIEVFLGNEKSEYFYEGTAIFLGSHSFYITLVDFFAQSSEIINIQFSTPHTRQPRFLRGALLALDRLRQPFSTRVVILRQSDIISRDEFDQIPPLLIDVDEPENEIEKAIIEYLKDEVLSSLRFSIFIAPEYEINELIKEKQWIVDKFSSHQNLKPDK